MAGSRRRVNQNQRSGPYSPAYTRYVNGRSDLVGIIAYCLYKESKNAFIEGFLKSRSRQPTIDEMSGFVVHSCLPNTIEAYRDMASKIVQASFRNEVSKEAAKESKDFLNRGISDRLGEIDKKLKEPKTIKGWFRDAGKELVSNILAIFVIGIFLFGVSGSKKLYDYLEDISNHQKQIEGKVKPTSPDTHSPTPHTTTSDSPTP